MTLKRVMKGFLTGPHLVFPDEAQCECGWFDPENLEVRTIMIEAKRMVRAAARPANTVCPLGDKCRATWPYGG